MGPVEVGPPSGPIEATVRPPASKSHMIRALYAAGLAEGTSVLEAPLEANDSRDAAHCLRMFGVSVEIADESWVVEGCAGELRPPRGPVNAGESGLAARFTMALAPKVRGRVVIEGRGRLPVRPMDGLLNAISDWSEVVSWEHPWEIVGQGSIPGGVIEVDASQSSQMASALMMSAAVADSDTDIVISGLSSSATYLDVTETVMEVFGASLSRARNGYYISASGYTAATYELPVDASSAVYPAAAAAATGGRVEIRGNLAAHPDLYFFDVLEAMGCDIERADSGIVVNGPTKLTAVEVDLSAAPDAAVTVAVLATLADGESRINGLASLRHKESDRLEALHDGLSRFGADVRVVGDGLVIIPGRARSTTFESRGDHRMAMAFSILGLVGPTVVIDDGGVVAKTWPSFWEWLETTGAKVDQL